MGSKVEIDGAAVGLLARLLTESNLTEIEYKQGGTHIRVIKTPAPVIFHSALAAPSLVTPESQAHTAPETTDSSVDGGIPVTSPLVGTVYLSPDPSAPPFITPGSTVKEGQTLLIVEAMKVMNPIRAPRSGIVKEICIDNASPVEFGEALLYLVA